MRNLLLTYARDLDDAFPGYEFSIWSAEQLLGYFNEALCLIATRRPDMFTVQKIVPVDTCNRYVDACDCVKVLDVLGQCDKNGKNVRPVQRRKERATVWAQNKKHQNFTREISSYELLEKSSLIRVYPANLDPTAELWVLIRCAVEPKAYSLTDAAPDERCAFLAAACQWVLYRAKAIDGEFSQTMKTQSDSHGEMFAKILGMTEQSDNDYDEKYRGHPAPANKRG